MPATAERPRPIPIPSPLLDEPTKRRSPPAYTRLPETRNVTSTPSPVPSTPKPVLLSPKTEKKTPLSSPPEPEVLQAEKLESKLGSEPDHREDRPEGKSGDIIDMLIFQQILELDDDGGDEFSREMVWAFFSQAESTFDSMDTALQEKNLSELSSLGHFLKGSSAALGVCKVQASCEKMQHYGQMRDESGVTLTSKDALDRIERLLSIVKSEYNAAEKWLKNYYKEGSS